MQVFYCIWELYILTQGAIPEEWDTSKRTNDINKFSIQIICHWEYWRSLQTLCGLGPWVWDINVSLSTHVRAHMHTHTRTRMHTYMHTHKHTAIEKNNLNISLSKIVKRT